jgi:hypothetical protein
MVTPETMIYKYPELKQLFVNAMNRHREIIYSDEDNNSIIEFYKKNPDGIETFYFATHPSNKAIEIMTNNIDIIHLDGLICNNNPNIGPLLELTKHRFDFYNYECLCESHNPAAMLFLEKNLDQIDWILLSENSSEGAIRLLEKHLDKIKWKQLSSNPSAIHILRDNLDKINWKELCKNPNAIDIIKQNMDKINWKELCKNPNAIDIIEQNMDKVNWNALCLNPNAIHILKKNPSKININIFSYNQNVLDILNSHDEFRPDIIDFEQLLYNPNAIDYIEKHLDKFTDIINEVGCLLQNRNPKCIELVDKMWKMHLISNEDMKGIINMITFRINKEGIFQLDYQEMSKKRSEILYDELLAEAFNPDRVGKIVGRFNNIDWI